MKFRTEVNLENSEQKILLTDRVFSVGSCFAAEMSEKLKDGQMQTLCNPFGTLFNLSDVVDFGLSLRFADKFEENEFGMEQA